MKQEATFVNFSSKRSPIYQAPGVPNRKTLLLLFAVAMAFCVVACGGISSKTIVYKGQKYPPYDGEVKVYWKEHGVPPPKTYELIATIGGRTTMCGFTKAAFHKELHDWIKEEAAKAGGNGVIIHCGDLGTVGECHCSGDVIRFK